MQLREIFYILYIILWNASANYFIFNKLLRCDECIIVCLLSGHVFKNPEVVNIVLEPGIW